MEELLTKSALVTGGIIFLVVAIVVAVVSLLVMRSFIRVARPDEALVISGKRARKGKRVSDSNVSIIVGGRAFIRPLSQRAQFISLRSRQITMNTVAQSKNNITLSVSAVALVKIDSNPVMVGRAAERFRSQDEAVSAFTTDQLEGALRGAVATLDVDELMRNRDGVASSILQETKDDLERQGLVIDSFKITGITDENGYIDSLGRPEIEEKRKSAFIAQTEAEEAMRMRKIETDESVLRSQTAYQQNVEKSRATVGQASAEADQAAQLANATAEREVLERQAENREVRLNAEVRKTADAERYRREQEAQAEAFERTQAAEAERRSVVLKAEADQQSIVLNAKARREAALAEAEGIRAIGEARAAAIEAEAQALSANQEAILAQGLIDILPQIMEAHAKGYSSIGKVTFIGTGGGEGGNGGAAGFIGGEGTTAMAAVFEQLQATTGISIPEIVQGRAVGAAQGEAFGASLESPGGKKDSSLPPRPTTISSADLPDSGDIVE